MYVALIGLEGDQRKKNVGEKSRFSWFREFFFYFLDLVFFTFSKLGKNPRLFFFLITCCFLVVISLI